MNTKTARRLASGTIANSGRFWVIPTQGPRLTDRHDLLGPYRAEGSAGNVRDKYLADGIPCEVVDSDERPVIEQPKRQFADELADSLRTLATMIEDHPEIAENFRHTLQWSGINVHIGYNGGDKAAEMANLARIARRYGATTTKVVDDTMHNLVCDFGAVKTKVLAYRDEVCERVVVGTREVTEEIPDPELAAAVPIVTITRTEEVVEWQCKPLLAAEQVQA
jgi:hypothetical protein